MFNCKTCEMMKDQNDFLKSQISQLNDQVKALTDKLLAVTHPHALAALQSGVIDPNDYYGSSEYDETMAVDEFGVYVPVNVADVKREQEQ